MVLLLELFEHFNCFHFCGRFTHDTANSRGCKVAIVALAYCTVVDAVGLDKYTFRFKVSHDEVCYFMANVLLKLKFSAEVIHNQINFVHTDDKVTWDVTDVHCAIERLEVVFTYGEEITSAGLDVVNLHRVFEFGYLWWWSVTDHHSFV